MAPAPLSTGPQSFTTHNQTGPLWCWFPSGWACARPRPLCVAPTTSPVRLGVSPAAAPTPMGVSIRGLRLYSPPPPAGALGCAACFAPLPFVPVYQCANVGPRGATCRTACPILCHSESVPLGLSVLECGAAGSTSGQTACYVGPTLRWSQSRQGNASPLRPGCLSPPLLPVWMNVSFLSTWCRTSLPFYFM